MFCWSDLYGDSCFEVCGSVVLVFLVVGEVTFLDTELGNSLSAIRRIVFPFDFFDALICLRQLDAFLHVLKVVAFFAIG